MPIKHTLFEDKDIFENPKIGLGQTRLESAVRNLKAMGQKSPFVASLESEPIPPEQLVTYVEADDKKLWKKSGAVLALSKDKRYLMIKSTTQS